MTREHHHHHDPAVPIPIERQATCPVTGDTVDTQEAKAVGHVREYKGQKYYFCCGACVQLSDKNPEKYAKGQLAAAEKSENLVR